MKTIRLIYPQWQGGNILTIAEPMPRLAIRLKRMLSQLPLMY